LKTDIRQQVRTSESIEMAARRIRHAFLSRVQHQRKASAIALAHHTDDQVELFFLRLFRGAGGSGLGGMNWSSASPADASSTLIRPLLGTTRLQILQYAERMRLRWREDASNADPSIPRNRIRHELIPLLSAHYCPALAEVLPRTMEILRSEASLLDAFASGGDWPSRDTIELSGSAREALARLVRRKQLLQLGESATYREITQTECSANHRGSESRLQFRRGTWPAQLVPDHGVIPLKEASIHWRKLAQPQPFHLQPNGTEQLDGERVGTAVILRRWRPGDRFQPLGMKVPAKLQDLFVNRKIPALERRERWLATTAAGDIFWVQGFPPGDRFKVTPQTHVTLQWSLAPGSK
jgi:tRNA(Ile)-lysidine synthase